MSTPVEVAITLKDVDHSFTTHHLCYDPITMSVDDPIIRGYVDRAIKEFPGQKPEDIVIKAKMAG